MLRLNVRTTEKTEHSNTDASSLIPPTKEEILKQLRKHFTQHDSDKVSKEDLEKLTEEIDKALKELLDEQYGKFAEYFSEKPQLIIKAYYDEWDLQYRENYLANYSPLYMKSIKCSELKFQMTVVLNYKQISLAYVSKECLF